MATTRSARAAAQRGSNVRELRPQQRAIEPVLEKGSPDFGYVIALVGLISVGMLMTYSTTAFEGGTQAFLKQVFWLGIGIASLLVAAFLPMKFWRKITPALLVICVLALASLLWPGNPIAIHAKGATRWLGKDGVLSVQPSEFTKLAFVLFAANFLEVRGQKMTAGHWGSFLFVMLGCAGLIYLEPDLGTALVLSGTAFCMLLASGVRWRALISIIVVGAIGVAMLATTMTHQKQRLVSWWNPWDEKYRSTTGYQVIQSWSAMSQGGWMGVGLGNSIHKIDNRLPEAETDFVFAVVAEELGLVRAVGLLLLFALLMWRGYAIAARAPDRYTFLIAAGITSWIAVQSCLNIAVVTGTVPNTGVPLPFISKGGSSLVALLAAAGLVVGISRLRRPPKKEAVR